MAHRESIKPQPSPPPTNLDPPANQPTVPPLSINADSLDLEKEKESEPTKVADEDQKLDRPATATPLTPKNENERPISPPAPDETLIEVTAVMEGIMDTLEKMNHRKASAPNPTQMNSPSATPLQTSRTRDTNLTDYTMVSDDDNDPIDVEKLQKEMRSAYLKEWGDMRGMVFQNDEEAELAFQSAKVQKKEEISVPLPPPLPTEEEPLKPATPLVDNQPDGLQDPPPAEVVPAEVTLDSSPVTLDNNSEAQDMVTPLPSARKRSSRPPTNSKSRSSSRRQSSLFQTVALATLATAVGSNDNEPQPQHDSDEENLKQQNKFRQNFPSNELEALLGFFPELRAEISELLRQKRHLKLDISEWKAEFFLQNGREANWSERKEAIGEMYERYHQVGYKANKVLKELIEAEDDLLKTWEARRERVKRREKK
jgi:hypothetical protein